MARSVSIEIRLERMVEAAARVFIRSGFRGTQMADVAREMGVATGTVYLYVESKEALFDLVMSRFPKEGCVWPPPKLPVPTPAPGATLAQIRERMLRPGRLPELNRAMSDEKLVGDAGDEFERVIRELYGRIFEYRIPILLMERSAQDWPELGKLFHQELRPNTAGMIEAYLTRRIGSGFLEQVPDLKAAARLILETITWFARYRLASEEQMGFDDRVAEETVVHVLRSAFVKRIIGST